MELLKLKEELKYVTMDYGEQCVMTSGIVQILLWYANNLDTRQVIHIKKSDTRSDTGIIIPWLPPNTDDVKFYKFI